MKKLFALSFFLLFSFGSSVVSGEVKKPWTIYEVLEEAKYKEKVLVQGKIKEEPSFDYFLLKDETGEIIVDARDLPKAFGPGDDIFIQGRYVGASEIGVGMKEIEAYRAAKPEEKEKVDSLIDRFGRALAKKPKKENAPAETAKVKSVKERLQELNSLKEDGLISTEEYETLRKKILEDL